ncbi:helix-turn-helix domain-containing protein [Streptomyces sp. NPDC004250]|uniref:helix-turn-helix domain-containing protein n=1 Tax=Streptomyces sp. NPDC004250 TaxID=3364692 RepID=UPI0036A95A78
MFTVAELMPHLIEGGITLSSSQAYRLIFGTPERLSLCALATLCGILDCAPTELLRFSGCRRVVTVDDPCDMPVR